MFLEDMRTLVYLVAVACVAALLFLCARRYKQHQEGVGEGGGARAGRPEGESLCCPPPGRSTAASRLHRASSAQMVDGAWK